MKLLFLAGAAIVLLAFCALAVTRPRVSLLTLVTLDVSNINGVIQDHVGTSVYKPQLVLAAIALLVMARRRSFRFAWSPVLLGVIGLYAGFCVSLVSAADPVTAQSVLVDHARDLFYFVLVFALVLSTDSVLQAVTAATAVLAGLAALTIFHQVVLHNSGDLFGLSKVPLVQEDGALTPRHAGTSSDVNFWARLLVLFTPLSLSLMAAATGRRTRLLWACAVLSLIGGIYLTQSRGGFIALFVGLVTWLALAGGRYRRSLLYAPVILAVVVPLSGIGSRLATLTAITASSTNNADPSVVTRERLQLDAWHMFLSSPITGHGIGSYGVLFPAYDRLSNFYQPVDIVVAAHNFYLEQGADGGVLLLLAWATFFGSVVFVALRSRSIAVTRGLTAERLASVGILAGITAWLVASVFLHLSDFRSILLVAAVAAGLDVRLRKQTYIPEGLTARINRPTRSSVGALVALAVAAAVFGAALVRTSWSPVYSDSATLAVLPASTAADPSTAYQLDVISRGLIVPTLAEVVEASMPSHDLANLVGRPVKGSVRISAVPSRLGGAIVLTVSSRRKADVIDIGAASVQLAKAQISRLEPGYALTGALAAPTVSHPDRFAGVASLGASVVAAASAWGLSRRRRRLGNAPGPAAAIASWPDLLVTVGAEA